MLLTEMDDMSRFIKRFLHVPNVEIFLLIDRKKFAQTSSEFHIW